MKDELLRQPRVAEARAGAFVVPLGCRPYLTGVDRAKHPGSSMMDAARVSSPMYLPRHRLRHGALLTVLPQIITSTFGFRSHRPPEGERSCDGQASCRADGDPGVWFAGLQPVRTGCVIWPDAAPRDVITTRTASASDLSSLIANSTLADSAAAHLPGLSHGHVEHDHPR